MGFDARVTAELVDLPALRAFLVAHAVPGLDDVEVRPTGRAGTGGWSRSGAAPPRRSPSPCRPAPSARPVDRRRRRPGCRRRGHRRGSPVGRARRSTRRPAWPRSRTTRCSARSCGPGRTCGCPAAPTRSRPRCSSCSASTSRSPPGACSPPASSRPTAPPPESCARVAARATTWAPDSASCAPFPGARGAGGPRPGGPAADGRRHRARARTVVAIARPSPTARLALSATADPARIRAALLALPGVGPWTADLVALRGPARPRRLPPRRPRAAQGPRRRHRRGGRRGWPAAWRPHRSLAVLHLWTHHALDPPRADAARPAARHPADRRRGPTMVRCPSTATRRSSCAPRSWVRPTASSPSSPAAWARCARSARGCGARSRASAPARAGHARRRPVLRGPQPRHRDPGRDARPVG